MVLTHVQLYLWLGLDNLVPVVYYSHVQSNAPVILSVCASRLDLVTTREQSNIRKEEGHENHCVHLHQPWQTSNMASGWTLVKLKVKVRKDNYEFKDIKCLCIFIKLGTSVSYDTVDKSYWFSGSDVKVIMSKYGNSLSNVYFPQNKNMLPMMRGWSLLILKAKVMGKLWGCFSLHWYGLIWTHIIVLKQNLGTSKLDHLCVLPSVFICHKNLNLRFTSIDSFKSIHITH